MTIVTTLNSVVRCGFAFGEGSTLLFNNSVCAAEDYNRLQASAQQLQESHDRFASSAAPRSSAESCNGEPIHCSLWGMRKWGEFLRSESNSWLDSRSTFCSQHCGNGELAKSACTAAAAKVFGPDANACSSVCGVTQCQNAVNYCVSYCCREDESCIDKTHAKLK